MTLLMYTEPLLCMVYCSTKSLVFALYFHMSRYPGIKPQNMTYVCIMIQWIHKFLYIDSVSFI